MFDEASLFRASEASFDDDLNTFEGTEEIVFEVSIPILPPALHRCAILECDPSTRPKSPAPTASNSWRVATATGNRIRVLLYVWRNKTANGLEITGCYLLSDVKIPVNYFESR